MTTRFDIQIQLHFEGKDGLTYSKEVIRLLDVIETATYGSDREDVIRASNVLDINPVIRDACLERLRHYRHKRFLLEEARPGSLALVGLVAGVGLYVFKKTIMESFTEGFKDSRTNKLLKETFRDLVDEKCLKIAENIRKQLIIRQISAELTSLPPSNDNSPQIIIVNITPPPTKSTKWEEIINLGNMLE
ncbi:hypothetical protein C1752_15935 [Acaryochloris thomasi RCC1774]|uniref:Uncharacterized protein n=1 Tax=Acaryochloris thomasi RCC1774 TaxID=1764569 RepID=A0A2W1J6J0_9CYAN|nr:hypothetical protein [Acaryochloris thomasi]PZD70243.1 hypothetical protein C1752_15935 [Acaryochloris thomasi RCC1774]